jgi:hypothetical protein
MDNNSVDVRAESTIESQARVDKRTLPGVPVPVAAPLRL